MTPENHPSSQVVNLFKAILLALLLVLAVAAAVLPETQLPVISLFISALSLLNFVFHEAGHILFGFMGEFISVAGGTAGQLFVPILFLVAALYRRQFYAAAFFMFWIGQNLINISLYIGDARQQSLHLISPGALLTGEPAIHDWTYLLGHLGLLWADHILAAFVYILGILIMLFSAAWPILYYYFLSDRINATPTPTQRM
jgi:hypothetical protein